MMGPAGSSIISAPLRRDDQARRQASEQLELRRRIFASFEATASRNSLSMEEWAFSSSLSMSISPTTLPCWCIGHDDLRFRVCEALQVARVLADVRDYLGPARLGSEAADALAHGDRRVHSCGRSRPRVQVEVASLHQVDAHPVVGGDPIQDLDDLMSERLRRSRHDGSSLYLGKKPLRFLPVHSRHSVHYNITGNRFLA